MNKQYRQLQNNMITKIKTLEAKVCELQNQLSKISFIQLII